MSRCQWLNKCCERVEQLQSNIGAKKGPGKRSADVPWSWMCRELFSLLSRYPTGVTNAIILSELQMLWSNGHSFLWQDGECKKISIGDFLHGRFSNPEAILEGVMSSPHDLAGTQIPLAWLRENDTGSPGASLEVYLHQKFYHHRQLKMPNCRVRLTRCRLQQSQSLAKTSTSRESNHNGRLLPTDLMLFLTDSDSLMAEGFSTQLPQDQVSGGYGQSVMFRISCIGGVVTVHSPDGGTNQQVCVTLSDDGGRLIDMILWDEHLQLAQLFKKGDWLALEKPYYQLYSNQLFIEYGPATVCFCVPFIPSRATDDGLGHDSILNHASIFTDDEGVASVAAYPKRLSVSQIQCRMKAMSLCAQITSKSSLAFSGDNEEQEEFGLELADHSGIAKLHISNLQPRLYHHLHPGQCLVVCGLVSSEQTTADEKYLTWDSRRKGCALWNVTSLSGWIASPLLAEPQPFSQLPSQGCLVSRVTVEDVQPVGRVAWTQLHCTCAGEVTPHVEGYLWCASCSVRDLVEEGNWKRVSSERRPLESCWHWSFSISLTLHDGTGGVCQAKPTDDCAQNLLQTTPSLFASLDYQQQCDLLRDLHGTRMVAFLSLCPGSELSLLNTFVLEDQ